MLKLRLPPALLLLAAGSLAASDMDCARHESGRKKMDWLYPPPAAEELPSAQLLESAGAFILVDEVYHAGGEKIYSFIAQLNNPASFAAFGVVEAQVPLNAYADIRARVYMPGEIPRELPAALVLCSLVRRDNTGEWVGRAAAAKHYLLHLPELRPGVIIQYQVDVRWHRAEAVNWMADYSRFINLYAGGQGGLKPATDPYADPRLRYPAEHINFVFNLPHGMDFRTAFYPDDGALLRYDEPSNDSFTAKIVRLSGYRPQWPEEPFAPSIRRQSPWALTHVNFVAGNVFHDAQRAPTGWNDWVARTGATPLNIAPGVLHSAAVACLRVKQPRSEDMEVIARCLRLNYADETAEFQSGLAVVLLQEAGLDAGLLYLHEREAPPLDREFPSLAWFAATPIVALRDETGAWRFAGDESGVLAGRLRARWQGGEGLLVRADRNWDWLPLPISPAQDNAINAFIHYERLDDAQFYGTLRLEFIGAQADALWPLLQLPPARRTQAAARSLDARLGEGVRLSELALSEPETPGAPLVLTARVAAPLRLTGGRSYIGAMPLRLGPQAAQFAASERRLAIDFKLPASYRMLIEFPPGLAIAAPPTPYERTAPGYHFFREWHQAQVDRLELRDETTLDGMVLADQYAELVAAVRDADAEQRRLWPLLAISTAANISAENDPDAKSETNSPSRFVRDAGAAALRQPR